MFLAGPKRKEVPAEIGGGWVELTPLTYGQIEEAERIASRAAQEAVNGISGLSPEIVQAALSQREERAQAIPWDRERLASLDSAFLVNTAVTAWSGDSPPAGRAVDMLTPDAVDFLALEVVRENFRPPAPGPRSGGS